MQVPVAVAQVPVCWSVPRNLETILAAIGGASSGTVLVLPEAALSGCRNARMCGAFNGGSATPALRGRVTRAVSEAAGTVLVSGTAGRAGAGPQGPKPVERV